MKQIVRIFLALATVAAGVVLLTIGGSAAGAQSDHELAVSENSNRSNASELSGANVEDDIFVFVTSEDGVDSVQFFLDGSNNVFQTENSAPYDSLEPLVGRVTRLTPMTSVMAFITFALKSPWTTAM